MGMMRKPRRCNPSGTDPPAFRGSRDAPTTAIVFALASTSGPVLGAYLTEHLSWRAVFAINLPLGLVAALLAWRIPQPTIVRRGRFRPDIVGALLFTLSALALLFALSSGGHRFDWRSWPMVALAGGALIGFTLLVIWERHAADPVIPIRFFSIPAIIRSDAVVICFAGALFSTILYLPLYLQLGRGLGIGQRNQKEAMRGQMTDHERQHDQRAGQPQAASGNGVFPSHAGVISSSVSTSPT